MKNLKGYENFLNESFDFEYWPDTIIENGIEQGMILDTWHGTENKILSVDNKPIHVGTSEQVDTRIDSLWDQSPIFYEHKITIKLTNPYPEILEDVDDGIGHVTEDFTKYGNYNEFVYHNTVEGYPDDENNLSIFIVDFKKSYIRSEIVGVIHTT
jgi:hypothetical protein